MYDRNPTCWLSVEGSIKLLFTKINPGRLSYKYGTAPGYPGAVDEMEGLQLRELAPVLIEFVISFGQPAFRPLESLGVGCPEIL